MPALRYRSAGDRRPLEIRHLELRPLRLARRGGESRSCGRRPPPASAPLRRGRRKSSDPGCPGRRRARLPCRQAAPRRPAGGSRSLTASNGTPRRIASSEAPLISRPSMRAREAISSARTWPARVSASRVCWVRVAPSAELALLERLERQRAAEGEHQHGKHADGNRASAASGAAAPALPPVLALASPKRFLSVTERIHQFWIRKAAKGLTGD